MKNWYRDSIQGNVHKFRELAFRIKKAHQLINRLQYPHQRRTQIHCENSTMTIRDVEVLSREPPKPLTTQPYHATSLDSRDESHRATRNEMDNKNMFAQFTNPSTMTTIYQVKNQGGQNADDDGGNMTRVRIEATRNRHFALKNAMAQGVVAGGTCVFKTLWNITESKKADENGKTLGAKETRKTGTE